MSASFLLLAAFQAVLLPAPAGLPADDPRLVRFGSSTPEAVLSGGDSFGAHQSSIAAYSILQEPARNGRPPEYFWVLRQVEVGRNIPRRVTWADSRTCPEVRSLLEQVIRFRAPAPYISGLDPRRPPPHPPGGDGGWGLWAQGGYSDGTPAALTVGMGAPGPRMSATLRRLRACWSTDEPVLPSRRTPTMQELQDRYDRTRRR